MKKILSIALAVLMLSLSLIITASAVPPPAPSKENVKLATFSEDFQNMFIDGTMYSRANTSNIYYYEPIIYNESEEIYIYDDVIYDDVINADALVKVKLSSEQKKTVDYVSVYTYDSFGAMYEVEIYYKDGSSLTASYLLIDLMKEYNRLINNDFDEFYVDFGWPEGNMVALNKEILTSAQTRKFDYWEYDDSFSVEGALEGGSLRYYYGEIRYINKEYYFYDPKLNEEAEQYINSDTFYDDYSYEAEPDVTLSPITDPATKAALDEALKKYYEDDMGYIYNDELLEGVSKVFLTILFGIIPFAAFVAFLVFTIKAKKKTYRKIYLTGCIVSLVEVATFIVTAIYLFKY